MDSYKRALICVTWAIAQAVLGSGGIRSAWRDGSERVVAPKIWDEKDLSNWATPVAGINLRPTFYSELEYYSAPIDNLRTYPVYHPQREPNGYREKLKKQGAQPIIEPEKLRTEKDWIEAGSRVFDELDVPLVRTSDSRALAYWNSADAIKKDRWLVTNDGIIPGVRWVVEKNGEIKLGLSDCSGCHLRVMGDGSVIRGAPGNLEGGGVAVRILVSGFSIAFGKEGKPAKLADLNYASFGVPWLKDDIHQKMKTMSQKENGALFAADIPGTFARFNGSPYYTTKMADLIGVRDRRYLDHTGTHRNRGPADIARYAALVSYADDGAIGSYRFLDDQQRKLRYRFSDEALYALGKFIYSLEPPPNPNKPEEQTARGQKVFERSGCGLCHTPPVYTNNMLIAAEGMEPPKNDPGTRDLHIMQGVRIGTDPGLALKTRKGTGYYRVPSLRGLWYRGLVEHSGSIGNLEDWFERKRLRDDFVPSGWKGPGVKTRAVKGHEFGLDLTVEDRGALIAFLKTL